MFWTFSALHLKNSTSLDLEGERHQIGFGSGCDYVLLPISPAVSHRHRDDAASTVVHILKKFEA